MCINQYISIMCKKLTKICNNLYKNIYYKIKKINTMKKKFEFFKIFILSFYYFLTYTRSISILENPSEIKSISFPDGKYYEGQITDSLMHGQGTLYFPNGQVYKGEF